MTEFSKWLLGLIKDLFLAIWDFITDLFISLVDLLLTALLALITAIPVPSFMTGGLSQLIGGIGNDALYFVSNLRLTECFVVLGSAVVFRLARKALTLFQW